jgi:hypothetical protein
MTREEMLAKFVAWTDHNITGDEKGQAQIFLDRLFQAFGQQGSLDVGGKPEFRIRKSSEDGGGTSFADFVWKPVVLIEMKNRGVNLAIHLPQTFKYWERLCPDRPRYVVLAAYGFDAKKDLLAQLLALNLDVAKRIEAGQPVTAPGVPNGYSRAATLITPDCIQP